MHHNNYSKYMQVRDGHDTAAAHTPQFGRPEPGGINGVVFLGIFFYYDWPCLVFFYLFIMTGVTRATPGPPLNVSCIPQ